MAYAASRPVAPSDVVDGCELWLRLAAAREQKHPEDAAAIYLKQAEAAVAANNGRNEDSVGLEVKAASVMSRLDRGAEFVQLEALRVQYKARRNFIKLVEQKRKSLHLA